MYIAGVLLAAGSSSRMGATNKLLLSYKNHTIVEEALTQLSNSRVNEVLVVTGHERERVEQLLSVRTDKRTRLVYNDRYQVGRAESIKRAVEKLGPKVDAALFMVADKPQVSSALINRAIDRFKHDRPPVLYVETTAGRGHPIIFSKALFAELLTLEGDRVGEALVEKYRDNAVSVIDETPQLDIDSEADYRILLAKDTDRFTP